MQLVIRFKQDVSLLKEKEFTQVWGVGGLMGKVSYIKSLNGLMRKLPVGLENKAGCVLRKRFTNS